MSNKKHFVMKFKNEYMKLACIVKIDKNIKFTKSKKIMEILQDKSKLRETILLVKDAIIPAPTQ